MATTQEPWATTDFLELMTEDGDAMVAASAESMWKVRVTPFGV